MIGSRIVSSDRGFLPQEALKLLACLTMLTDHVGAVFFPGLLIFRLIGRMAFPLYCFLLAEGVHHTRHKGKYLLRLAVLMVLSELPFDYGLYGVFTMKHQSVMVTLLLGASMLMVMEKIPFTLRPVVLLPFCLAANLMKCDYGWHGILMIGMFGLSRELPFRLLAQCAMLAVLNYRGKAVHILGFHIPNQFFALSAMLPIALYSGKKLSRKLPFQLGFNLFYPVHLAFLWIFRFFL